MLLFCPLFMVCFPADPPEYNLVTLNGQRCSKSTPTTEVKDHTTEIGTTVTTDILGKSTESHTSDYDVKSTTYLPKQFDTASSMQSLDITRKPSFLEWNTWTGWSGCYATTNRNKFQRTRFKVCAFVDKVDAICSRLLRDRGGDTDLQICKLLTLLHLRSRFMLLISVLATLCMCKFSSIFQS